MAKAVTSHLTTIAQCFAGTVSTQKEANVYFLMLVIIFHVEVVVRKFSCMGFYLELAKLESEYPEKQQEGVGANNRNEI